MMNSASFWVLLRIVCHLGICILGSASVHAQMKVGGNPTALASDANFQVEANNGGQVVVRKSSAQVGIGTSSPSNSLEINSGSSGNSGVRLTQLQGAGLLGTNANGDIVKVTSTSACTCGDIKASVLTSNHGDWKLMNGSSYTGSCGTFAMDASNAVLVQSGTVGTSSAATGVVLQQNQLPNVTLGGTTQIAGAHTHTWDRRLLLSYEGATSDWLGFGQGANENFDGVGTTSVSGGHVHAFTTSSINGGVTQQAITLGTNNLPTLNVKYFICIN